MFRSRLPRFVAMAALIPAAALSLHVAAWAQSPATAPDAKPAETPAAAPATPPPAAQAPATPSTAAPSTAAPSATAAPTTAAPATPAPVQAADPFGEATTLTPKQVIAFTGKANWDSAFDTLMDAFRQLTVFLDKQGIKPSGNPLIVYTSTDDTGFTFLAEYPVEQELKNLPKSMTMTKSPEGQALRFIHRGSYDNMDNTYEAITNHLDDKKLEAKDTFIEEYLTDPLKTAEDKLIINVFVPLK